MKELKCAAYTMMGRRTRNQDNFLLGGEFLTEKHGSDSRTFSCKLDNLFFAAVVDGNGTKETGEAASRLVCETFQKLQDSLEELNDISETGAVINKALVEANRVIEAIVENAPNSKMGATCALMVIYGSRVFYANVGDSAVYLRRGGEIKKLTTDHTEGEELIARGALTRDMLKNHSSKNKVTRMIGYLSFGQEKIMQFYDPFEIEIGDVFVLASPGIVQYMAPEDIDKGLQTCIDVLKSAERVVKSAHGDFESKDNITALVVRVSEEADNVGSVKARKAKPIRGGGGVRLQTEVEIDPKAILRVLYVIVIALILIGSAYYMYKAFPREQEIEYVPFDGYSWEEFKTSPKADTQTPVIGSDNADVKDSDN